MRRSSLPAIPAALSSRLVRCAAAPDQRPAGKGTPARRFLSNGFSKGSPGHATSKAPDGVVTVGSGENDDRPFVLWQRIQDRKAIQPGHLDIEEYKRPAAAF